MFRRVILRAPKLLHMCICRGRKQMKYEPRHFSFVGFVSGNMSKAKYIFVLFSYKFDRNSFWADERV